MVSYPVNMFHKQKYTINKTFGEATVLFGDPTKLPNGQKLTIEFDVKVDNTVEFKLTNAYPTDPKRDFIKEAGAARMIYKGNPRTPYWPSPEGLIMGYINKGDVGKTQQLFMMWLEPNIQRQDPFDSMTLMIFFFNTNDCFSGGAGNIDGTFGGPGQENGSGIGNGPNRS